MLATQEHLRLSVYHKPSRTLAQAANSVGYDAWLQRFVRSDLRTRDELRHVFDPDNPQRLLEKMRDAATIRRFAGVVATGRNGREAIGGIWGADDISGPVALRMQKRAEGKEYAWVAQLNVRPAYWGLGVGKALLATFLRQFDDRQPTSVYVFRENWPSLHWFQGCGYTTTGRQERDFFGPGASPVTQVRLQATTSHVLGKLQARAVDEIVDEVRHV
ncbi:MAG TPA: GNAT family N-acetyltransferase [Ktedonobacteraceae bacterium]|nr:GNAT family N-acetyltransferase [Ktedonobacteraceae bacterium]